MKIPERQAELDALTRQYLTDPEPDPEPNGSSHRGDGHFSERSDEEIIAKACAERGGKFDRLYRGDTSDKDHNHSDADDSFIHKIWSYTQDEAQVYRIHATSGLSRPKSARSDYLQRSINRARKNVTWFYEWPEEKSNNKHSSPNSANSAPPPFEGIAGEPVEDHDGGDGLPPELELTDLGNSLRFARRFAGRLIYSPGTGGYAEYRAGRYVRDDLGQRFELAKAVPKAFMSEAIALALADQGRAKALAKHGITSSARPRIESMVALAHSDPRIAVATDKLDNDPYLFNCNNGSIDLRTGDRRDHDPADRLTRISPVEHVEDAECPTWHAFLERILPDESLRLFIKRWFGWCLTGIVNAEILPIFYGTGANGKSTLVNVLLELLGDYGQQAPQDLLMVKRREHPTELADLFGRRLVASAEIEEGVRLNESLVKQLTGRERVRARYMRENFFEFAPTHKLVLLTNHKPTIRGSDKGIWRRLKVVPFEVCIPEAEQDRALSEKLRGEYSGILQWAIEGCLEWQREGLPEVASINAATDDYREEQDRVGTFLDECCIIDQSRDVYVLMATLYPVYQEWCKANGEPALTKPKFGDRLEEKGYPPERVTGNKPARRRMTLHEDAPRPDGGGPRMNFSQGGSSYPSDSNTSADSTNNANSQGNSRYPVNAQGTSQKSCKTEEYDDTVTSRYPKVDMNGHRKTSRGVHSESRVTPGNKVTLTAEQEHFVGRLVEEGMSREWAIAEVVGDENSRDISEKPNDSSRRDPQ